MKPPRTIVTALLALLAGVLFVGAASALEVGQKAPDFTLNGTDGKPVKLSDLTAKGPIVLYTFIAAFTGNLNEGDAGLRGGHAAVPSPGRSGRGRQHRSSPLP